MYAPLRGLKCYEEDTFSMLSSWILAFNTRKVISKVASEAISSEAVGLDDEEGVGSGCFEEGGVERVDWQSGRLEDVVAGAML